MFRITIYQDSTDITVIEQTKEPELKQLQGYVDGYIEQVPEPYYRESNKDWFARKHTGTIDAVWCNEEGLYKYETANKYFTPASWGDSLYGNIVVVEKL